MKKQNPEQSFFRRLTKAWGRIAQKKRTVLLTVCITFLGGLAIIIFGNRLLPTARIIRTADYQEGMVADKDIVVQQGITYIDEEATRVKQDAALRLIPSVFFVHEDITEQADNEFEVFRSVIEDTEARSAGAERIFLELQSRLPDFFSQEDIISLLSWIYTGDIILKASEFLHDVMVEGVLRIPDSVESENLEIVRWKDGLKEREVMKRSQAMTPEKMSDYIRSRVDNGEISEENAEKIALIISRFIRENAYFDEELTDQARRQTLAGVEPVMKKLNPNEVIVRKGFVITADHIQKIRILGNYSASVNINGLVGSVIYLIILIALTLALYSPPLSKVGPNRGMVVFFAAAGLFYMLLNLILPRISLIPDYIPYTVLMPTALIAMLVSILYNGRGGIVFTVLLSLSLFICRRESVYPFVFAFLSGISGTMVVMGAEKRITLVRATLFLSALHVAVLFTLGLFQNYTPVMHLRAAGAAIINGVLCGILNIGLLPFFEHMLNVPTPFRLMELSDLNTPLFRRMLILAPGTYSHSISVANLAESACRAIGADGLLARVGAYYHDIGKIDQAEYFIENQISGNKHDELKPTLSTAVIKAHVKTGVEKGRDLGLPTAVIDIISQHHGSGLISYFYIQAMKEQEKGTMNPADFSYNGTPPMSKEAAVVMLADSVEAASRIMKKPTMAKLEKFVWTTIMEKITDRQMRNAELTFKDMEVISKTFVQILAGHFHSRIEYPDMNGIKS